MKAKIHLNEEDIRKAILAHFSKDRDLDVTAVTIHVSRGYEGNQFDHEDPSVRAEVEYVVPGFAS
jgi:TolB-like protein